MAIRRECECGMPVLVPDHLEGVAVPCPRCKAYVLPWGAWRADEEDDPAVPTTRPAGTTRPSLVVGKAFAEPIRSLAAMGLVMEAALVADRLASPDGLGTLAFPAWVWAARLFWPAVVLVLVSRGGWGTRRAWLRIFGAAFAWSLVLLCVEEYARFSGRPMSGGSLLWSWGMQARLASFACLANIIWPGRPAVAPGRRLTP